MYRMFLSLVFAVLFSTIGATDSLGQSFIAGVQSVNDVVHESEYSVTTDALQVIGTASVTNNTSSKLTFFLEIEWKESGSTLPFHVDLMYQEVPPYTQMQMSNLHSNTLAGAINPMPAGYDVTIKLRAGGVLLREKTLVFSKAVGGGGGGDPPVGGDD